MYDVLILFCFFKQKTAYEMRISDWSSDVCASDLAAQRRATGRGRARPSSRSGRRAAAIAAPAAGSRPGRPGARRSPTDRKSVVSGKSVSVRVDLGGRRILNKQTTNQILTIISLNQTKATIRQTSQKQPPPQ